MAVKLQETFKEVAGSYVSRVSLFLAFGIQNACKHCACMLGRLEHLEHELLFMHMAFQRKNFRPPSA